MKKKHPFWLQRIVGPIEDLKGHVMQFLRNFKIFSEMTNIEPLEFRDRNFGDLALSLGSSFSQAKHFDPNTTALIFDNCRMESFTAVAQVFNKPVQLNNCTIGWLGCHGTWFHGGFQMTNCLIEEPSTFDGGVHNMHPNEFIIDHCIFNGHVDFFDVWFEGPVRITNNHFREGTSIALYLKVPNGIKEGIPFSLENNKGELYKYAENDPFNPQNKKK
jgi:hypothetical protein